MDRQNLNQYWKTVVDTIQDGVMIVNPEGTIISVNRGFEEITGYGRDEVLGQPCTILNCSSCEIAREKNGCHWCVMFERGNLKKQKCLLIHKSGRSVHVVKNASVLKDETGEVTGAVETMTDITDLIDKETQLESYRRELSAEDKFYGIIGMSAQMQQLFELITDAAQSDAPIIIFGESGTGKELVAQAIHEAGHRSHKPFVKVNCAALNESLLESELFGHVKGAFTGAYRNREGRFEAANGGDIFLDEIGDLPLSTQIKLLRVMEDKIVERVGEQKPIKVDVRTISATNRNLSDLIRKGEFREDFYYRINVIPIRVPALRERRDDIPLLARSFFNRLRLKSGKNIRGISNATLDVMLRYKWPGNVRELKSALEFAFVSCQNANINPEHLPFKLTGIDIPQDQELLADNLADIKKQRLIAALRSTAGNQSKSARILRMSRTSVWKQMKQFNLKPEDFKTV